jgi:hypothetical protein
MPATEVRLFKNERGLVPVQAWLDGLEEREPQAYAECLDAILQLERKGYELRRPISGSLGDGIHELRIKIRKVHFRILYFFYGKNVAALSSGIRGKKGEVEPDEIKRAINCVQLVKNNPTKYTAFYTQD